MLPKDDQIVELCIVGQSWKEKLTFGEYKAWAKYQESHPQLLNDIPYEAVLKMFLCNTRMGVDLNAPKNKHRGEINP